VIGDLGGPDIGAIPRAMIDDQHRQNAEHRNCQRGHNGMHSRSIRTIFGHPKSLA
jgi:hypothetical protein